MTQLKGKVAIVTGSSRGIGAEIAYTLAAAGAKVVINYNGSKESAEEVAKNISVKGGSAVIIQADVSKASEAAQLFDQAMDHFGQVDILINNAGIMMNSLIKDVSDEDFTKMFDVNVKGVFNMLKQASTKLAENGSIVNFSSSTTRLMMPGYGIYSATKAAVEQMSRVFSKEIGERGINVNSILPGGTNTELFKEGKSDEVISKLASMSAFNRIGEPEDIAKIVLLLCSDEAKWMTGQNIGANGGTA
ncbi:SDR family oxidoreductase [Flavobacterium sp. 7A]|uniref:SDR family oxidoreductase n=1 Tax=Flavobacterium sp. 7A TaxID=2940571 RepID=UPI0022262A6C|nr:SDR family oxidoreductase [Flavobacterium sp. 7A]MCW2118082.1 3-oxoacyl-[acyl-carrier protein] reductase [Flavobacterium sp. 7A]